MTCLFFFDVQDMAARRLVVQGNYMEWIEHTTTARHSGGGLRHGIDGITGSRDVVWYGSARDTGRDVLLYNHG